MPNLTKSHHTSPNLTESYQISLNLQNSPNITEFHHISSNLTETDQISPYMYVIISHHISISPNLANSLRISPNHTISHRILPNLKRIWSNLTESHYIYLSNHPAVPNPTCLRTESEVVSGLKHIQPLQLKLRLQRHWTYILSGL